MTPERAETIKRVLTMRQPDLTLLTDSVVKGRNLAAIVRTCDAVGVSDIHAVMAEQDYSPFRGTTMGSHRWVDLNRYSTMDEAITTLKSHGAQVVAAQQCSSAVDYTAIDFTRPTVLVVGAEKTGVSQSVIEQSDRIVAIPMMGMVESYNVSVAAAILLNEARVQRLAAGFYGRRQISDEIYQRLFFRWGYPKLAGFCDKKSIPYPLIDNHGDIDDPEGRWRQMAKTLESRVSIAVD